MTHPTESTSRSTSKRSWIRDAAKRHLVVDIIYAILAALLFVLLANDSVAPYPSLLLPATKQSLLIYSLLAAALLTIRRTRPEIAAWLFVGITVIHLIFGPAITYGDFLAPFMLYSAIEYSTSPSITRFVVAGTLMTVITAVVWPLACDLGTLYGSGSTTWSQWSNSPTTARCEASLWGASGTSGTCSTQLAMHSVILLACIGVVVFATVVLALWQRARNNTITALQERNAALEASEAEARIIAASAERARLSRDMHDVVAHTLSTIIVQADGGRYAGIHDRDVARSTMQTIRQEASDAQHDMTQLFSAFGRDSSTSYHTIDALVSNSPLPATRHIVGSPQPERLSAQAEEAVYRLVQESLSNARKYAGADAEVSINEIWTSHVLSLTVTDNGQGSAAAEDGHTPGYGLVGMRERIEAVGGSVEASSKPNGGFLVAATIPLEGIPAASDTDDVIDTAATTSAATSTTTRANWVTRLAGWCDQHYLLTDILEAVALLLIIAVLSFGTAGFTISILDERQIWEIIITLILLTCCAVRRRFPESCALVASIVCALQIMFFPPTILLIDLIVLPLIYAAVLYGRDHAWRWILAALAIDAFLLGLKFTFPVFRNGTIVDVFQWRPESIGQGIAPILSAVLYGGVVLIAGLSCIGLAKWRRSQGDNALVLRQREEALQLERERQKTIAANLERERISAAMQTEVTATLGTVITQADNGLAMLDTSPTADDIAAAFTSIASEGRTALAHMRSLLTVLRQTGSSADGAASSDMPLTPKPAVNEQLQSLVNPTDANTEE